MVEYSKTYKGFEPPLKCGSFGNSVKEEARSHRLVVKVLFIEV
jgi:hypothetical protein